MLEVDRRIVLATRTTSFRQISVLEDRIVASKQFKLLLWLWLRYDSELKAIYYSSGTSHRPDLPVHRMSQESCTEKQKTMTPYLQYKST